MFGSLKSSTSMVDILKEFNKSAQPSWQTSNVPALTFREQVALIATEKEIGAVHVNKDVGLFPNDDKPIAIPGKSPTSSSELRQQQLADVGKDVCDLTNTVCRAMEESDVESPVHAERNRCTAILRAAKDKATKEAEYPAVAALRHCLDAVKSGQQSDEVKG